MHRSASDSINETYRRREYSVDNARRQQRQQHQTPENARGRKSLQKPFFPPPPPPPPPPPSVKEKVEAAPSNVLSN